MTVTLEQIRRPKGKLYRPRKVIAYCVSDADDCVTGIVVFGTHDPDRALALARELAADQVGRGAEPGDPVTVWWRDGFEGGYRMWVTDEERGRAGVWFREIEESP